MSTKKTESAEKLVVLPGARAKRESEKKWGLAVMQRGFCIVPSILLRAQRRLGLSPTQLALILQLCDFWWKHDDLPWPKKETLGQRMNLSTKQIQRLIKELEDRGYVKLVRRTSAHGQTSNAYDLSGLVEKIRALEPEFAEASGAARRVERRGGLKNLAATPK